MRAWVRVVARVVLVGRVSPTSTCWLVRPSPSPSIHGQCMESLIALYLLSSLQLVVVLGMGRCVGGPPGGDLAAPPTAPARPRHARMSTTHPLQSIRLCLHPVE
jgi:hypothetical protein